MALTEQKNSKDVSITGNCDMKVSKVIEGKINILRSELVYLKVIF